MFLFALFMLGFDYPRLTQYSFSLNSRFSILVVEERRMDMVNGIFLKPAFPE